VLARGDNARADRFQLLCHGRRSATRELCQILFRGWEEQGRGPTWGKAAWGRGGDEKLMAVRSLVESVVTRRDQISPMHDRSLNGSAE
jgi:hypothetical protein